MGVERGVGGGGWAPQQWIIVALSNKLPAPIISRPAGTGESSCLWGGGGVLAVEVMNFIIVAKKGIPRSNLYSISVSCTYRRTFTVLSLPAFYLC
jgi:hypothetical protein